MSERVVLKVEGMNCESCVRHVRRALEGTAGVRVEDVGVGHAVLTTESAEARERALRAVEAAGYEASAGGEE